MNVHTQELEDLQRLFEHRANTLVSDVREEAQRLATQQAQQQSIAPTTAMGRLRRATNRPAGPSGRAVAGKLTAVWYAKIADFFGSW